MSTITETIKEHGVATELPGSSEEVSMILEHWEHRGIECAIYLTRESHYCGYCRVPDEILNRIDPTSSLDDERNFVPPDVDVHGGVTYGPDDDRWIGFDCNHAGDLCVDDDGDQLPNQIPVNREPNFVWSSEDVKEETESLADQVADYRDNDGNNPESNQ